MAGRNDNPQKAAMREMIIESLIEGNTILSECSLVFFLSRY